MEHMRQRWEPKMNVETTEKHLHNPHTYLNVYLTMGNPHLIKEVGGGFEKDVFITDTKGRKIKIVSKVEMRLRS